MHVSGRGGGYLGPFGINGFLLAHRLAQILVERAEEVLRVQERRVLPDEQGEVLGHLPALDGPHADVLQRAGERGDAGGAVEFAAVLQAQTMPPSHLSTWATMSSMSRCS